MSEYAGIVQDELRDLRGNAMVGAVVRVREAGTSTPATLYDNPVQISAATGADALVNDATTGLPAASGLLMPGVDSGANYTFFADSDEEYDLLVTWNGLTFEYRVRPKVLVSGAGSIPPGTFAETPVAGTRGVAVIVGAQNEFTEDHRRDPVTGATRSDDATMTAAVAAAFPNNGAGTGMVRRLIVGTSGGTAVPYTLTTNHQIGVTGRRYYGADIRGVGRGLTRINWNGDPASGPFTFLNVHMPNVQDISFGPFPTNSTVKPAWWLKFDVEAGQSGFRPRTKNLDFFHAVIGMILGSGTAGQMNNGLHEGLGFLACDTAVELNTIAGEIQTFNAPDFDMRVASSTCFRAKTFAGLQVFGGEATFHEVGDNYFIRATGSAFGAGWIVEGVRLEEAWCLASFLNTEATYNDSGNSGPLNFVASDIVNRRGGAYTMTDPCNMFESVYQTTATFTECEWPQPNTRIRQLGLQNGRVSSYRLKGCKINNAAAVADPTALFKLEAGLLPGATSGHVLGGMLGITEGCMDLVGVSPVTASTARIPSGHYHQTISNALAGTKTVPMEIGTAGVTFASITTQGDVVGPGRVDTFATPGNATATKPSWAKTARLGVQGGGGGGGGGRRGAAGTARVGGGPGAAGGWSWRTIAASALPATFNVTTGGAGTAGAAATADDTNGGNGGAGGTTYIGASVGASYLAATGGGGGAGGQSGAGGTVGTGGTGLFSGTAGIAAPITGAAAGGPGIGAATGGGPGGGITTADAPSGGGSAAAPTGRPGASAGAGGTVPGGAGGAAPGTGFTALGEAQGGGGGAANILGAGGDGAAGRLGGGGGGGGASLNGANSGVGGAGGPGLAVIEWTG